MNNPIQNACLNRAKIALHLTPNRHLKCRICNTEFGSDHLSTSSFPQGWWLCPLGCNDEITDFRGKDTQAAQRADALPIITIESHPVDTPSPDVNIEPAKNEILETISVVEDPVASKYVDMIRSRNYHDSKVLDSVGIICLDEKRFHYKCVKCDADFNAKTSVTSPRKLRRHWYYCPNKCNNEIKNIHRVNVNSIEIFFKKNQEQGE